MALVASRDIRPDGVRFDADAPDREPAPMTEPTPRRRTLIPPLAWLFVVFAIVDAVWYVLNATFDPNTPLADVIAHWVQVVPSVTSILLPAALLARHPDAGWRARTLLIGTIVLAVSQGLVILSAPLEGFFAALTPSTQDQPVGLASLLFADVTNIVIAVGLITIGLGLSRARRYEDRPEWVTGPFVVVLAIIGTIDGIVATAGLDLNGLPMSLGLAVYLASSAVLGVVRIVAWGYLAAMAWRGAFAGESPAGGWRLASIGSGAVILALVLIDLAEIVGYSDEGLALSYITIAAYSIGNVLLLAAFAVGLPSLDELEDEDEDEGEDDEDDGDEDDEDDARYEDDDDL